MNYNQENHNNNYDYYEEDLEDQDNKVMHNLNLRKGLKY